MITRRTFNAGTLYNPRFLQLGHYGYDNTLVFALSNTEQNGGLVPVVASASEITGPKQVMRFDSQDTCERWIQQYIRNNPDLTRDQFDITTNRGEAEYILMPVANFDEPCWVNHWKYEYMSPTMKRRLAQHLPEYFSEDDDIAPPSHHYRGFRF